jgi:flagellar motor switch protein FliG
MSDLLPHVGDGDRAAIMLMVMDENQASEVLSRLDPDELRRLGEKMCALGEISPEAIAQAISTFVVRTEQVGLSAHDRVGQVRTMMSQAVGEVKANGVMKRIAPPTTTATTLDLARWLDAEVLLTMIGLEHPQVIAVLLVQLDPDVAAQVLQGLPAAVQAQVVHRIACLGPVRAEAIAMLDTVLNRRISHVIGTNVVALGGPREAANIINKAHRSVERQVMPALNKLDKKLALQVEQEMVKFEHLFALDDKAMGAVLRDVESDTLVTALKGITPEQREIFLAAMSARAADGVRDEIELRGRVRRDEVEEAQKAMIAVVRRLADAGEIAFGASGDDDYV